MDQNNLNKLIAEIVSQGFDEKTAALYAELIGDTPIIDKDGYVVVTGQHDNVLTRLKLKFFDQD